MEPDLFSFVWWALLAAWVMPGLYQIIKLAEKRQATPEGEKAPPIVVTAGDYWVAALFILWVAYAIGFAAMEWLWWDGS